MNKSLVIKLVIVLVVAVLSYSVFWFFKIGQMEKQVNKFISENSAYVSASEVSVSGFPFSQKITVKDLKFTIPNAALDKRHAVVKHLEATTGVFSSEFSVALIEPVTAEDNDGNIANVEFSKEPEISISISEGRIAKLSYQDSGYRIVDAEKNVLYAASSSAISIESSVGEGEKITTKLTAEIKDIEGFSVIDIYKNSLEKKIIDGIKTGEIAIGNASSALIPAQAAAPQATATPVATAQVAPASQAQAAPAATVDATAAVSEAAATAPAAQEIPATIADNSIVKSNFTLSVEYILTPNSEQQAQIPLDPTQIQEAPLQYSKLIKINNLKFANPLYEIVINGEMHALPDDNLPSGGLSIRIDKVDNLVSQISTGLTQITEKTKPVVDVQALDLVNTNGAPSEDGYQTFLKRISAGLSSVSKELAAKNAVSKEQVAQFDVRREKNLDFLINETTLREILGKF